MSLRKKQSKFAVCIASLIAYATKQGYEVTFGDAYRDNRLHGEFGTKKEYGHKNSVHKIRLAVDLNLFVDDEYITSGDHPAYQELGEYWKTLDVDARWGGDFDDANHFSFTHWGAK